MNNDEKLIAAFDRHREAVEEKRYNESKTDFRQHAEQLAEALREYMEAESTYNEKIMDDNLHNWHDETDKAQQLVDEKKLKAQTALTNYENYKNQTNEDLP